MKYRIIPSALIASALLLSATLSFADESKSAPAADTKALSGPKTTETGAKAKHANPARKVKLVDINSASKAQLKKLPGIGDAEADKIIAGRPYLSKAYLLTQNVLSRGQYENIHMRVIAKPNQATAAKLKELQKRH